MVVPFVILGLAATLGTAAFSLARRAQVEQANAPLTDAELFAIGAAEAKRAARRPPPKRTGGRLERHLHEAGIPLSETAYAVTVAGIGGAVGAILCAATSQMALFPLGFPLSFLAAHALLARQRERRSYLFDTQLARCLPQISAAMKTSGFTLDRAIRTTTLYLDDPLREEFRRLCADTAYGTSIQDAFDGMAGRTQNTHLLKLAAAVRIQLANGGNLAPTLDRVATAISRTIAAQRERKTEIASMRFTKWVVMSAMPLIALFKAATDPSFLHFYQTDPLGWLVAAFAVAMEIGALLLSNAITSLR